MNLHAAPFISTSSVQQALDALTYTANKTQSPSALLNLALVDEQLTDAAAPPSAILRQVALQTLLTDAILSTYAELRQTNGLSLLDPLQTAADVVQALADDSRSASVELLSWAVLYARYVRVDVPLDQRLVADALGSDVRTVRRYHQHGVSRLTEALTRAEWQARQRSRNRRLRLSLPSTVPPRLYGREDELQILNALVAGPPPHHVIIQGVAGSGKTALIQSFLHGRIAQGELDNVVWLTQPPTLDEVQAQVAARLLPVGVTYSVREWLQLRSVAIVLDDAEALFEHRNGLNALLQEWASGLILLACAHYQPLHMPHQLVRLGEIPRDAADRLVRDVRYAHCEGAALEGVTDTVWRAAGGHPLLLLILARSLEMPSLSHDTDAVEHILPVFDAAYAVLTPDERLALAAFLLLPPGEVLVTDILDIWYGLISPDDINGLLRHSLIVARSLEVGLLELPQAIRTFLVARLTESYELKEFVSLLVERLDRRLAEQHPQAERFAEHLLRSREIPLPPALRQDWLLSLAQAAIAEERVVSWRNLLRDAVDGDDSTTELRLLYGVCLRMLAAWGSAEDQFRQVLQDAGRSGDFALQANALVELATLERSRGHYDAAGTLLRRAEGMCARLQLAETLNRIRLEQAQIAVDAGAAEEAESLLGNMQDSLRVVALRAEARLLMGDTGSAERNLSRAYDFLSAGAYNAEARLRTLLARTYEQAGELHSAREHFAAALTRLEQGDDLFALNRARTNLAAVLLMLDELGEVTTLLQAAESEQALLGDAVGLAATRHNMQILRLRRARPTP